MTAKNGEGTLKLIIIGGGDRGGRVERNKQPKRQSIIISVLCKLSVVIDTTKTLAASAEGAGVQENSLPPNLHLLIKNTTPTNKTQKPTRRRPNGDNKN
jgi:hypothetical protein